MNEQVRRRPGGWGLLAVMLLVGCPDDPAMPIVPGTTESSGGVGSTTTSMSTGPLPSSTSIDPDTTMAPGTTEADSSGSSGSSGSSSESGDTNGWGGMQGHGDCINVDPGAACLEGEECFFDDARNPLLGVCLAEGCSTAAECPVAPPGGDAVVACGNVFGDLAEECYLDCSAGKTCPTGMECFMNSLCLWPKWGYADCLGGQTCLPGETCVADNAMMPTGGMCANQNCDFEPCPPAPPGGNVVCGSLLGPYGTCFLSCENNGTCPAGMICYMDYVCMWPFP